MPTTDTMEKLTRRLAWALVLSGTVGLAHTAYSL